MCSPMCRRQDGKDYVTIIIIIIYDNLYSAICTGSTSRALRNKQNNCRPNAINIRNETKTYYSK